MKNSKCLLPLLGLILGVGILAGCGKEAPAPSTRYESTQDAGRVTGVGIESQDIVAMTDKMMRDMMTNPNLAGRKRPPRVIIDSEYFRNEGSTRINKNLITDRLRIELNRAANGRMLFVSRENMGMVQEERQLKRDGTADSGTMHMTRKVAGADYRLAGRINTLDAVNPEAGTTSRYNQITFEMIDLESGLVVWGGMYEFKKSSQDDIIYR